MLTRFLEEFGAPGRTVDYGTSRKRERGDDAVMGVEGALFRGESNQSVLRGSQGGRESDKQNRRPLPEQLFPLLCGFPPIDPLLQVSMCT